MHETIYAPDYYILEHFGIKGQKVGREAIPES